MLSKCINDTWVTPGGSLYLLKVLEDDSLLIVYLGRHWRVDDIDINIDPKSSKNTWSNDVDTIIYHPQSDTVSFEFEHYPTVWLTRHFLTKYTVINYLGLHKDKFELLKENFKFEWEDGYPDTSSTEFDSDNDYLLV